MINQLRADRLLVYITAILWCAIPKSIAQNGQWTAGNDGQENYSFNGRNNSVQPSRFNGNAQTGGSSVNNSMIYSGGNQSSVTVPSFPSHPFSAEFIARSGERYANNLRTRAIDKNNATDPEVQAEIKAALFVNGAAAIRQAQHGDCWFESAVAAVAHIPRGQQILADMIVQDSPDSYVVTFPWHNRRVRITNEELKDEKTKDNALWTRIVEAAAIKRWHGATDDHQGTKETMFRGEDVDVLGLSLLTGVHAETFELARCSPQEICNILNQGCSRLQPMEASTNRNNDIPLVNNHAYAVISYDPQNQTVILRNPWGRSGKPKDKNKHPNILLFGESREGVRDLGGGLVQMTIPAFQRFYRILVWAQI